MTPHRSNLDCIGLYSCMQYDLFWLCSGCAWFVVVLLGLTSINDIVAYVLVPGYRAYDPIRREYRAANVDLVFSTLGGCTCEQHNTRAAGATRGVLCSRHGTFSHARDILGDTCLNPSLASARVGRKAVRHGRSGGPHTPSSRAREVHQGNAKHTKRRNGMGSTDPTGIQHGIRHKMSVRRLRTDVATVGGIVTFPGG